MKIKLRKIKTYIPLMVIFGLFLNFILHYVLNDKIYIMHGYMDEDGIFFTRTGLSKLSETNDTIFALSKMRPVNRNYDLLQFHVFSLKNFETLSIQELSISMDSRSTKLKEKVELNCSPENISYDFDKKIDGYEFHFYGDWENNYKINLQKLFRNKKTNFGDRFDIQIYVHYFLDDREYITTLNYTIECRKNEMQYPPDWYMFLFPGAW